MIYKLQRRFVLICTVSIFSVMVLVFGVILALNVSSLNKNMDILADRVSEGRGRFPSSFEEGHKPDRFFPKDEPDFNFITPETPFSTRHFTVLYDQTGEVAKTFTESIYSITDEQAIEYAQKALAGEKERGWLSNYRYKIFYFEFGSGVVFVDGSMNRSAMMQSMAIAGAVLFACAGLVLVLIFLLSKKAVKPIAESYEKQKQFVTDANHELKTPLTLILANIDIAESELGQNEWLDDIRSEGYRMTELVNQLVELSRLDEDSHTPDFSTVRLGAIVSEIITEFEPLAAGRGRFLQTDIDENVTCAGNEMLLRRLVGILMDNAVKYCDQGGTITIKLYCHRRVILVLENSCSAVSELELNRLFDRFYRGDKARTFNGSYGIGLSMAKSIVEKHKGEISAYKKESAYIGFKVVL